MSLLLVEHSFVVTTDAAESMGRAAHQLRSLGFEVSATDEHNFVARRGVKQAARAKRIDQLPQIMRVNFDRGRVTVAGSIEIHGKAHPVHSALLRLLADSIEEFSTRQTWSDDTQQEWNTLYVTINELAHRRRSRRTVLIVLLVVIIISPCFAGIMLNCASH